MSFEWGSDAGSQDYDGGDDDDDMTNLFRSFSISDIQTTTLASLPDDKINFFSNDDDNNNNNNKVVVKQTLQDQLGTYHCDYPKNDAKGKEEDDSENDSCSEEVVFVRDTVTIPPQMRTNNEIHGTCLDRWDDVYPENSNPNHAGKFENSQIDWDARWYGDKIETVYSERSQKISNTTAIPAGITKDYAVAVCGHFERDIEAKNEMLSDAFRESMKASIKNAWDITTITVLEEYFKYAQECGALNEKHAKQVSKAFKAQRRSIAQMTEELKAQLKKEEVSKEEEQNMAARLMNQYDHPIRKNKTESRQVDAFVVHELKMISDNKNPFPVYDYTMQEPMKKLVKDIKKKESSRKQKNRKRHDRRKQKQNANSTTKQSPAIVISEKPKSLPKSVQGEIMFCPFGGYKNKQLNWKSCQNSHISTTGVFHVGSCGDLASSTKNGITIHSIPSGTKTEEFRFPEEQFAAMKQIFIDERFLCCVFEGKRDNETIEPCQAIIINRETKQAKAVAVTTKGQITAICTELAKESIWLGFSNGIALCVQWKDSTIDDSFHSLVVLSTISPITKMYRVGRQLHCQIVYGINSIDVIPMKGETINAMLSRAGDPVFTRFSMMSAFSRRGTIRVILLRSHNISIGHTATPGLLKVLMPPDNLTSRQIRLVTKESEDKKGQIIEEEECVVPKITAFPLEQYIKIDKNKISVLYSNCTARVIYTTPKTRKEKLAENKQQKKL